MADTTTISDLTEKQTLVDTDKILVEDTNGVGQALLGSAITDKINGALANLDKIKFATVRSGTNLDIILNDYKGKVYFQLCDNNSSGTKPSGVTSGIVQTLAWDSGNYATQIYTEIDTNHRMFIRYNNNGTWTSWEKLATESDTPTYKTVTVTTNENGAILSIPNVDLKKILSVACTSDADLICTLFNGSYQYIRVRTYQGANKVNTSVTLNLVLMR